MAVKKLNLPASGLLPAGAYFIMLILLVSACEETITNPQYVGAGKGVFICNEGNFTFGNASLSFYGSDSMQVHNQVFFNANRFPPGDVLQSMTILDTLGFLVINNSGKILVISTNTFRHIATISGLNSPRYMLVTAPHKAYISDLYSGSMAIVDPNTFEITGSVSVGATTERMVHSGNHLFATGWSMNNKVYKIDTRTDQVTDSLTVALQPNSIVMDKNDMVWVLSDGAYPGSPAGQEVPALTMIDPVSFSIVKEIKFPGPDHSPTRLTINNSGDTLCFLNGSWNGSGKEVSGVYKMSVKDEEIPDHPFIAEGTRYFYGLGVDPVSSEIYVSDALDFLQKGWVFRYNPAGTKVDSFKVDIAPGEFCFTSSP